MMIQFNFKSLWRFFSRSVQYVDNLSRVRTGYVLHAAKLPLVLLVLSTFIIQSCEKDPDPVAPLGADGFFVVNEGGFGNGNASLSYYDRSADLLTNNVFATKNGRPLGDQAQSMTVFEGRGYIVVQNSSKVEVIDANDFSSIQTITTDIESPRYFIGITSTKGYLSDWGADGVSGTVKVVDLQTNKIIKSISTGKGSNRMLKKDNFVYVVNAGGFDRDNTVKVIDTNSDAVVKTITVGDNPNSLQADKNGNIWVASGGHIAYNADWSINEAESTNASLSKIENDSETLRLNFDGITYNGLGQLNVSPEGDKLYFNYNGAVYTMNTDAVALPTTPLIPTSYYGLAVDPFNGNIVGMLAPNFSSAGKTDIYSADGVLLNNHTVGIAPTGCAFK